MNNSSIRTIYYHKCYAPICARLDRELHGFLTFAELVILIHYCRRGYFRVDSCFCGKPATLLVYYFPHLPGRFVITGGTDKNNPFWTALITTPERAREDVINWIGEECADSKGLDDLVDYLKSYNYSNTYAVSYKLTDKNKVEISLYTPEGDLEERTENYLSKAGFTAAPWGEKDKPFSAMSEEELALHAWNFHSFRRENVPGMWNRHLLNYKKPYVD